MFNIKSNIVHSFLIVFFPFGETFEGVCYLHFCHSHLYLLVDRRFIKDRQRFKHARWSCCDIHTSCHGVNSGSYHSCSWSECGTLSHTVPAIIFFIHIYSSSSNLVLITFLGIFILHFKWSLISWGKGLHHQIFAMRFVFVDLFKCHVMFYCHPHYSWKQQQQSLLPLLAMQDEIMCSTTLLCSNFELDTHFFLVPLDIVLGL